MEMVVTQPYTGIDAMSECQVDDKMIDNIHILDFMYGSRYVLINLVLLR